jgi:hypothetical protein
MTSRTRKTDPTYVTIPPSLSPSQRDAAIEELAMAKGQQFMRIQGIVLVEENAESVAQARSLVTPDGRLIPSEEVRAAIEETLLHALEWAALNREAAS